MKLRIFLLTSLLFIGAEGFAISDIIDSLYQIAEAEPDGEFFRQEGKKLKNENKYEEALLAFKESLKLFTAAGDSIGIANTLNSRGVTLRKVGKDLEAIDDYLLAATINKRIGNDGGLANNYLNLANYYAENLQHSRAKGYLKMALPLYEKTGNKKNAYGIANTLSTLYYTEEYEGFNLDSAEYYLQMAYDGFVELNEERFLPGFRHNFGMLEEMRGNLTGAIDYYFEAREGYLEQEDYYNYTKVNLNIGNAYLSLEQPERALEHMEEGKAFAIEYGYQDIYQSLVEQSIRVNLMMGQTAEAERNFIIYDSLKEAAAQNRVSEKIVEMEEKYQSDLKEQELVAKEAALVQSVKERNTVYTFLIVVLILTILIIIFYTQRQRALKQLSEKQTKLHHNEINQMLQDHEQKRLHAMIDGQEKERYRIATDLHDRLGSTLSAVKLHMNAYESMTVSQPVGETAGRRDKLSELLDRAVNEVREISHDMLSGVLTKFGLGAALEDLKETLESSKQYRVHLQIINLHDRIDNTLELNLYRIVQELVSNILKHAEATMITIQVNKLEDEILLMVEDDGVGFSPDPGTGDGVGLQNVADRVRSLNGHLHVDAQPGRGASITVEIPTP